LSAAGTLAWFARHESRLAWRDGVSMMTAGRRERWRVVTIALVLFAIFMHGVAYMMVARYADMSAPGKSDLIAITASLLLMFCLMVSQAMESVTRAFYSRSDLDLILSSPVAARRLFIVRIATIVGSVTVMAGLLSSPFINVLAVIGGAHWLAAYGVAGAMGSIAAVLALAFAVALFRVIGPRRTRLIAQVVAAVIGAAFVIGLQIAAIQSYGTLSRSAILQSDAFAAHAPDPDSVLYWPARAALGNGQALGVLLTVSLVIFLLGIAVFSIRFGDHVIAAVNAPVSQPRQRHRTMFRRATSRRALRHKEWTLLLRDPWLVSQSLIQLLYLAPPALMLWKSFADGAVLILLVPVLVMAAGQLAGGLAWLAISGEDAPDLVATAPVPASWVVRAKIEAVLGAIAAVFSPFVLILAVQAPWHGMVATIGILAASAGSIAIQLWFRAQAKRSHFRRRQISSRFATFAEAFSSITIAATAALVAAGTWLAAVVGGIALLILGGTWLLAPRR
jgi:ABC-2 type transport system permease protein